MNSPEYKSQWFLGILPEDAAEAAAMLPSLLTLVEVCQPQPLSGNKLRLIVDLTSPTVPESMIALTLLSPQFATPLLTMLSGLSNP